MKNQINFRASALTINQIDQLMAITQMSQTELISNAIGMMYRNLVNTRTLAEAVYFALHLDVDNKYFKADKVSEIANWLNDGGDWQDRSVNSLVDEWQQFDIPEERDEE